MNNNINVAVGGPVNADYPKVYKTKFLKPGIPFSLQVTEPNTKYVIKHNFDLGGGAIVYEGWEIEGMGGNPSVIDGEEYWLTDYESGIAEPTTYNLVDDECFFVIDGHISDIKEVTLQYEENAWIATKRRGYHARILSHLDPNEDIIIPEGCILEFDGGSLSNGTLIGSNTQIVASKVSIFTGIVIAGTWNVPEITSAWFSDAAQENKLQDVFALQNDGMLNEITIEQGEYYVSVDVNEGSAVEIKANANVINLGHIVLLGNNFERSNVFLIASDNVLFTGGKITGDTDSHTGSTGEWGMGISIVNEATDIKIEDVEIEKCWGDGIYIAGDSKHVTVNYCNIHDCRRQGISVIQAVDVIIHGCNIQDISGTAPRSCIDIEPNSNKTVEKVSITHCTFSNPGYRIIILSSLNDTKKINNVLIEGNTFGDSVRPIDIHNRSNTITNISNVTVRSNRLESTPSKGFLMWGVYNLDVSFNNIICNLEGEEPSTTDGVVYFNNCKNAYFTNNNVDSWDTFLKVIGTDPIIRDNNIDIHNSLSVGKYVDFENNKLYVHSTLNIDGNFRNNVIIAEEDFNSTRFLQLHENGNLENNVIVFKSANIQSPVYCRAENIIKDNLFVGEVDGLTFENLITLNAAATKVFVYYNRVEGITLTDGLVRENQKVRTEKFELKYGDSALRPLSSENGAFFFDTTLGKPIYWNGTEWVDATGTPV